jgi:thiol-disulfide isomerase/thioredoxin
MFIRYSLILPALMLPLYGASKEPAKAELNLKDMNGQKVRLRDYRGKAVVLNFWATWCGPCKAELPMLVEAAKNYESRGVAFVAVSLDDEKTRQLVPAFVSAHQITFPVWMGASGDDLAKLGLGEAVPATAFLDQDGHIMSRILGQLREEDLKQRLDWLTGDKTGAPPEPLVKHLENLHGK